MSNKAYNFCVQYFEGEIMEDDLVSKLCGCDFLSGCDSTGQPFFNDFDDTVGRALDEGLISVRIYDSVVDRVLCGCEYSSSR